MRFLPFIFVFGASTLWGQMNSLSLDSCLHRARLNYPVAVNDAH
jgi:hypothetical protein